MSNLRRIDLNLFTVFEAIYQERNLTYAANRIGMSQPAASNALKRLRALFDDELFVRQGNTMQPTPRARELASSFNPALDLIRDGLAARAVFDPTQPRAFNIAGIEHLEHFVLASLLNAIGPNSGRIRLNAVGGFVDEFKDDLKSGEIDLAIDHVSLADEEFEVRQLGQDTLVCLVRQGHPSAGKTLNLDETLALDHVCLKARDHRGFVAERFLRANGRADAIMVRVTHFYAMLSVIENSNLVGTMPRLIAERFLAHYPVAQVRTAIPERAFRVLLIWHRSQTHDPGNAWLREHLIRAYSSATRHQSFTA